MMICVCDQIGAVAYIVCLRFACSCCGYKPTILRFGKSSHQASPMQQNTRYRSNTKSLDSLATLILVSVLALRNNFFSASQKLVMPGLKKLH